MTSKKEKLAEFHKNSIIEAAKNLFAERGVAYTKMDDIAIAAGYSKSTLYAYFKSKDEIFNHIILEHITILKTAIETALKDNPGFPEGYYAICNALSEFYNKYPTYFESIIGEIKIPKDESEAILISIYQVGEEINHIIEDYIKHSRLDVPALQATFTLWSAISGVIIMAHKKEMYINKAMSISKERFMQDGFAMLMKGIL
ncbi:MAG: TetR/AcrR family transcriptional regulator [Oscillospiraceae bacterium]|nr:TetR/AcrR family transcriptional regulator [Oscillospiraceae bacterium]